MYRGSSYNSDGTSDSAPSDGHRNMRNDFGIGGIGGIVASTLRHSTYFNSKIERDIGKFV